MVRFIRELCENGKKEITFTYNGDNKNDVEIIKKFEELCKEQDRCDNCKNFYHEGCFGGYQSCNCKIHGCLEVVGHPHYDMDGSKCENYERK